MRRQRRGIRDEWPLLRGVRLLRPLSLLVRAGPDEDECTGVVAWQIENGEIDGVDVTGPLRRERLAARRPSSLSHEMRVVLLVDAQADDAQHAVSRLRSPGGWAVRWVSWRRYAATWPRSSRRRSRSSSTTTPRASTCPSASACGRSVRGSTKRPITIGDGLLATLLGTPGVVGKSSRYRLSLEAAGIDIDVAGRSTTSGRFGYAHAG